MGNAMLGTVPENSPAGDREAAPQIGLRVRIASAEAIRAASHGEVTGPELIDALTERPIPGGLCCERIFGPTRDYTCGCGRVSRRRGAGRGYLALAAEDERGTAPGQPATRACPECGVPILPASARRERMGHIELAVPIAHSWYVHGAPCRLALVLGLPAGDIRRVVYGESFIVEALDEGQRAALLADLARRCETGDARGSGDLPALRDDLASLRPGQLLTAFECDALERKWSGLARCGTGAVALHALAATLDLPGEIDRLRAMLAEAAPVGGGAVPLDRLRGRLRVLEDLRRSGTRPVDLFFTALPVLPAGLRPLLQLGGRLAVSDLNELYGRVIRRNARLRDFIARRAPAIVVRNEMRLLQLAVDALIDNGRQGPPATGRGGGRPLASLTRLISGKPGRFRRNLLGKRVDYSGRSVIAVGPDLALGQCGLPRRLALEIFKPFVMRLVLRRGYARTIKGAKRVVERMDPRVWPLLAEATRGRLVLLNRAPTLHRLSIQAFAPVLMDGDLIRLHPLACKAFNADFDGDQMAIHLPLSRAAQREARELLAARANLLSPATGEPAIVPQQEIVLGCYYLTLPRPGARGEGKVFLDAADARLAWECGVAEVGAAVTILRPPPRVDPAELDGRGRLPTTVGRLLFNAVVPVALGFRNATMGSKELKSLLADCHRRCGPDALAALADAIKDLGFRHATRSGLSIGLADMPIPPERASILAAAAAAAGAAVADHARGLLGDDERGASIQATWREAKEAVGEAVWRALDPQGSLGIMIRSGARGNRDQLVQMGGFRGLILDMSGRVIGRPVARGYRDGLTVADYVIGCRGARKGFADRALNTAEAGYFTRRLVEAVQDIVVTEEDCGTGDGLLIPLRPPAGADPAAFDAEIAARLTGRVLAAPPIRAGDELTPGVIARLLGGDARPTALVVRSPLRCRARRGLCRRCYGHDLATGRLVALGAAVGVIAAQSIGEPGTQLTMKTFQTGGVASAANITRGFPRVIELFEARRPAGAGLLAGHAGTVDLEREADGGRILAIRPTRDADEGGQGHGEGGSGIERHRLPAWAELIVSAGDRVSVGDRLTAGPLDPALLLRLRGRSAAQEYLAGEIRRVYGEQGVAVHDQHIEVIVGRMLGWVIVADPGDSASSTGECLDQATFVAARASSRRRGGRPPTGRPAILGLTAAALAARGFLAAASFQETARILADAALGGRIDPLDDLKSRVLLGALIPAGTGYCPSPEHRAATLAAD